MVRNFESAPDISKKLLPQFKGPYEITQLLPNDRYVVSDPPGFQNTQRPYIGTWEASNMRSWIKL